MKLLLTIWISVVLMQEVFSSALVRYPRHAVSKPTSSVHTEYEATYEQKGKHGNGSYSTVSGKQEVVHDNCNDNWNAFADKCATLIKDLVASLGNAVSSKPGDATNLQLRIRNTFKHFDSTDNCTCLANAKNSLSSLFDNITVSTGQPARSNGTKSDLQSSSCESGQSCNDNGKYISSTQEAVNNNNYRVQSKISDGESCNEDTSESEKILAANPKIMPQGGSKSKLALSNSKNVDPELDDTSKEMSTSNSRRGAQYPEIIRKKPAQLSGSPDATLSNLKQFSSSSHSPTDTKKTSFPAQVPHTSQSNFTPDKETGSPTEITTPLSKSQSSSKAFPPKSEVPSQAFTAQQGSFVPASPIGRSTKNKGTENSGVLVQPIPVLSASRISPSEETTVGSSKPKPLQAADFKSDAMSNGNITPVKEVRNIVPNNSGRFSGASGSGSSQSPTPGEVLVTQPINGIVIEPQSSSSKSKKDKDEDCDEEKDSKVIVEDPQMTSDKNKKEKDSKIIVEDPQMNSDKDKKEKDEDCDEDKDSKVIVEDPQMNSDKDKKEKDEDCEEEKDSKVIIEDPQMNSDKDKKEKDEDCDEDKDSKVIVEDPQMNSDKDKKEKDSKIIVEDPQMNSDKDKKDKDEDCEEEKDSKLIIEDPQMNSDKDKKEKDSKIIVEDPQMNSDKDKKEKDSKIIVEDPQMNSDKDKKEKDEDCDEDKDSKVIVEDPQMTSGKNKGDKDEECEEEKSSKVVPPVISVSESRSGVLAEAQRIPTKSNESSFMSNAGLSQTPRVVSVPESDSSALVEPMINITKSQTLSIQSEGDKDKDCDEEKDSKVIVEDPQMTSDKNKKEKDEDCDEEKHSKVIVEDPQMTSDKDKKEKDEDCDEEKHSKVIVEDPQMTSDKDKKDKDEDCEEEKDSKVIVEDPQMTSDKNKKEKDEDYDEEKDSKVIVEDPQMTSDKNKKDKDEDCDEEKDSKVIVEDPQMTSDKDKKDKDEDCEEEKGSKVIVEDPQMTSDKDKKDKDEDCEEEKGSKVNIEDPQMTSDKNKKEKDEDYDEEKDSKVIVEDPQMTSDKNKKDKDEDCDEEKDSKVIVEDPQMTSDKNKKEKDEDYDEEKDSKVIIEDPQMTSDKDKKDKDEDCEEEKDSKVIVEDPQMTSDKDKKDKDEDCDEEKGSKPDQTAGNPPVISILESADDTVAEPNAVPGLVVKEPQSTSPKAKMSEKEEEKIFIVTPVPAYSKKYDPEVLKSGDQSTDPIIQSPKTADSVTGFEQVGPTIATAAPIYIAPVKPTSGMAEPENQLLQPGGGSPVTPGNEQQEILLTSPTPVKQEQNGEHSGLSQSSKPSLEQHPLFSNLGKRKSTANQSKPTTKGQKEADPVLTNPNFASDDSQSESQVVPVVHSAEDSEVKPTTFQTTSTDPTPPQQSLQSVSPLKTSVSLIKPSSVPQDSYENAHSMPATSPRSLHDDDDDEEDCCSCESCTEEEITNPKQFKEMACKDLEDARKELKAIFDKIKKRLKCGKKAPQKVVAS